MADNGKWFKVWTTFPTDEKIADLALEDVGRWILFGAYLKAHGTEGSIRLSAPCKVLQNLLRVDSFDAVIGALSRLPNCKIDRVSCETIATVTFVKWPYYQRDSSTDRVRKFRHRETLKKRGEEKRREEKRDPPKAPRGAGEAPADFEAFWNAYPRDRRRGKYEAVAAWKDLRLSAAQVAQVMTSLETWKVSRGWREEGGKYIPWPVRFLKKRRWEETVEPERRQSRLAEILGEV